MDRTNTYNQIAKATGIFGGVQIINIITKIARSKLIAILLGPTGVGTFGLYQSAISLVYTVSSMGLRVSAVRTISQSVQNDNPDKIIRVNKTLKSWILLTGFLGTILVLIFSKKISFWTFSSLDYTLGFMVLSLSLLIQSLTSSHLAILQGYRKLSWLAKANVYGSLIGLLFSVPIIYYFRYAGIVPTILISFISSLLFSWFYAKKIKIKNVKMVLSEIFSEGFGMVQLGIMLTLSSILTNGTMYLLRIYITKTGGLTEIGYFQVFWAIINGYVGMIFTAMSTDYFPRLAAKSNALEPMKQLVNQQAEIALLILSPILVILSSLISFFIKTLYSAEFSPVNEVIQYAIIGIFFKTLTWSMGYIILAKGEGKTFLLMEIVANILSFSFSIIFYNLLGLKGIGMAFSAYYALYLIIIFILVNKRYCFKMEQQLIKISIVVILFISFSVFQKLTFSHTFSIIISAILIISSILFSINELRKRIDLTKIIKKIIQKF
jgi:PST family polysaccharide transporter